MTRESSMEKKVDYRLLEACLAWAVAQGDIVNFRFVFMPASPFRASSSEDIGSPKYAYLMPVDPTDVLYQDALTLVRRQDIAEHVRSELERNGPPRLPWQLVLTLADNAVRLGKYTAAAQAYELLRIRRRVQEMFLEKADALLDSGDIEAAVEGYYVASGLHYDYAAFPEPMPAVPDYQTRALQLHARYPMTEEQAPANQPDHVMGATALRYLLLNPDALLRFNDRPDEVKLRFAAAFIRRIDPGWEQFVKQYQEALAIAAPHEAAFERINRCPPEMLEVLETPLLDEEAQKSLHAVQGILTGETHREYEWWQCLKALCYRHPGAALFVTRQRFTGTQEAIVPKIRRDSLLAQLLGLSAHD